MDLALTLRDARADDSAALAALKLTTFRETFLENGFGIPYPPADLAAFEAAAYDEAHIAAELADPLHRTWVVADADGALVAYAHVGPCKLPHAEVRAGDIELYQLYLLGRVQGARLGTRLLDVALAHCDGRGGPVWLGVWSGNERARRVYVARGFAAVGTYHFRVGTWLDDEMIMRRGPART